MQDECSKVTIYGKVHCLAQLEAQIVLGAQIGDKEFLETSGVFLH
jgi:hypothetical protein